MNTQGHVSKTAKTACFIFSLLLNYECDEMRSYSFGMPEMDPNVPITLRWMAATQYVGSLFRDVFGRKAQPIKPDKAEKCPYLIENNADGSKTYYNGAA